jgi:hypothetical protein
MSVSLSVSAEVTRGQAAYRQARFAGPGRPSQARETRPQSLNEWNNTPFRESSIQRRQLHEILAGAAAANSSGRGRQSRAQDIVAQRPRWPTMRHEIDAAPLAVVFGGLRDVSRARASTLLPARMSSYWQIWKRQHQPPSRHRARPLEGRVDPSGARPERAERHADHCARGYL